MESRHTLSAQVFPVALYLVSLIQTANTPSHVITAFCSNKWVHEICDLKSPTDSKIVENILESVKRISAKPKIKKRLCLLIF